MVLFEKNLDDLIESLRTDSLELDRFNRLERQIAWNYSDYLNGYVQKVGKEEKHLIALVAEKSLEYQLRYLCEGHFAWLLEKSSRFGEYTKEDVYSSMAFIDKDVPINEAEWKRAVRNYIRRFRREKNNCRVKPFSFLDIKRHKIKIFGKHYSTTCDKKLCDLLIDVKSDKILDISVYDNFWEPIFGEGIVEHRGRSTTVTFTREIVRGPTAILNVNAYERDLVDGNSYVVLRENAAKSTLVMKRLNRAFDTKHKDMMAKLANQLSREIFARIDIYSVDDAIRYSQRMVDIWLESELYHERGHAVHNRRFTYECKLLEFGNGLFRTIDEVCANFAPKLGNGYLSGTIEHILVIKSLADKEKGKLRRSLEDKAVMLFYSLLDQNFPVKSFEGRERIEVEIQSAYLLSCIEPDGNIDYDKLKKTRRDVYRMFSQCVDVNVDESLINRINGHGDPFKLLRREQRKLRKEVLQYVAGKETDRYKNLREYIIVRMMELGYELNHSKAITLWNKAA